MARFGDIHADPIPSSEIPVSNAGTPKGYVTIQDITNKAAEAAPVKSVNGKQDIVVVTKDDVGLGNADNTSDVNKPISSATQAALDNKSPLLNDTGAGNSIIANPNNASVKKIAAGDGVSITSNTTAIIISSTGGGDSTWGNISGTLSNQVDLQNALNEKASQVAVSNHIGNSSNPHNVTKSQVGLGSVDNTSDANKPISNATQAALNTKADTSVVNSHTSNTSNPHGVTKTQVGLGSVDNTSDVNKPISTATQVALNAKAASLNDSGSGNSQIVNGGAGTIKKLEAGANVLITDNGDRLTISSTGGGGGGSVDWGAIGGTLSSQSDLWSVLGGKSPVLNDSGGGYSIVSNGGTGEIKKLAAGTNVSISDSGTSLIISASGGGASWGSITGTLSSQTDLQSALNAKANSSVSITGVGMISGGGDLTSSRTLNLAAIVAGTVLANTSSVTGVPSAVSLSAFKTALSLSKSDVGLGSVDNTTDLAKPISSATQSALNAKSPTLTDTGSGTSLISNSATGKLMKLRAGTNVSFGGDSDGIVINSAGGGGGASWGSITGTLSSQTDLQSALSAKADTTTVNAHLFNTSNPHGVTKTQVGLGNADNTSDINKPISTATQTALNAKSPTLIDAGSGTSLISNSATGKLMKLRAGTNVSFGGDSEGIVINASGGGGGSGTVTSVGLTPPTMMQVSGSPVTTSGNIELSWTSGQQPYTKAEVDTLLSKKPGVVVCTRAEWEAAMQAPYPLTIYVGCDITFDTDDLSYGLVTNGGDVQARDPKYDKNIIGINGKPTITVIGDGTGTAGQVISFRSAINLLVKNIRFVSSTNNGFVIQNYQRVAGSVNKTIIIEDCIFENCYKPIIMSGAITSNRSGKWIIRGNKFINCGASDEGYPAVIAMQGNISDVDISGNTFMNCVWNAVHIYHKNTIGQPRAGMILVKGNLFDGYGRNGIEVFSSGNSITTDNVVRNWFSPSSVPSGTSGIAISITGTYPSSSSADTNFIISNNIIENFRYYGIELIHMVGCTCNGNVVKKSSHLLPMGFDPKGICVSDCYGSVVSGNYIEDVDYTYSTPGNRASSILYMASAIQMWMHYPNQATQGTENLITSNTIRNCSRGIHLNNVAEQFITNNLICFSTENYNHKSAIIVDNATSGHVCRSNIAKNTVGTASTSVFYLSGTSTIFTDDLGTQVTGPGTFSGGSNLIVS